MELKKRETINEREYAKKNEVSKREVKNTIPKKWLVASSVGIVTLLYSNPNSIFGHIGVVFGCVSFDPDFTPLCETLNMISGIASWISFFCFIISIAVYGVVLVHKHNLRKITDEELIEKKKRIINKGITYLIILLIITVLLVAYHLLWENILSNNYYFIEGTKRESFSYKLGN